MESKGHFANEKVRDATQELEAVIRKLDVAIAEWRAMRVEQAAKEIIHTYDAYRNESPEFRLMMVQRIVKEAMNDSQYAERKLGPAIQSGRFN